MSSEHAPPPNSESAAFVGKACNSKLAPVLFRRSGSERLLRPLRPFVSVTYASVAVTCPDACPFKSGACYVQAGATKKLRVTTLDAAARGMSADDVIVREVLLIDGAFRGGPVPQDGARGGRDLRLHVGGDVGSEAGARLLAEAAVRWTLRGGGRVWTFTHLWREVPKDAFAGISVLASAETPEDIELARRDGYACAIVVDKFSSAKAFSLPGTNAKIIPCPAETRGTTCVECRFCLDADALLDRNVAIAFAAHGSGKKKVVEKLVRLRSARHELPTSGSASAAGLPVMRQARTKVCTSTEA